MRLKSDKYRSGEKALTKKDYEKLLEVIDNIEDELLIKLAIATGIRREDLVHIRIANISLEDQTLTYHEQKKDRERTISITSDIVLLIKKFLKTISKRQLLFSFSGRTAYRHLNTFCVLAGIPERPFHALRATCVKFCQSAGWTPEQVSSLTGDSIRTIEQHYSVPSFDEMREVTSAKPII
ncbi:site-specific integrase [Candidatus Bathyarchaeota archaeon]|nr:site-specific integrase [Candidatus Bathyarchaeota archaeon]